jgi:hypothetical protein
VEPAPKERAGGSTTSRQQQEAEDEEMSVATSLAHLVQQDSVVSGVGVHCAGTERRRSGASRRALCAQGRRQRGGRRGLQPPYCLRNKATLLQFSLKFSAINECLG